MSALWSGVLLVLCMGPRLLLGVVLSQADDEQSRPLEHMSWHFLNDPVQQSRLTQDAPSEHDTEKSHRVRRAVLQMKVTLVKEPKCVEDMKKLCATVPEHSDDLTALECIQSKASDVSPDCQHIIHSYMMKLMDNSNLQYAAEASCGHELDKLNCQATSGESGKLLACILDHLEEIESEQCRLYFQRVEHVAFSDFRVFAQFMTDCKNDIEDRKCGRLQSNAKTQRGTLACLQGYVERLAPKCRRQVLHLSALQAENVHLDRELYAACAEDHLRFCPDVQPGSGKVYKCLLQFRMDRTMSKSCQDQLGRYQKLIAQDYRVSRGLVRACRDDIRTYHCRRSVSDDKDIRLAQILLCLEGCIRNGSKVSRNCQVEMMEHRKILMEDYRLSPEIVSSCSEDISKFCNSLEVGGKTIHCLMERARPKRMKDRVSLQCQRALEVLVKEVDAGEDWRVDPVLREACKPVVDHACQEVRGGDARVIHCLMDKLGTDHMTEDCEAALLQIQYFVARDFKLDPLLYRQCREDAVSLCHAKKAWYDDPGQMDPERGPLVLPCLYRYAYHHSPGRKLKRQCLEEVQRVMRQRALSVDLSPDVEQACLDDLAQYCYDKTGRGEETVCLQDRLEKLRPQCREVISNLTEDQAGHWQLNPIIATACKSVMHRHCEVELGRDEGDMMDCLIKHKNEPDVRQDYKCRAAIEHFQLISIKNYHFTYKFKEACRVYVVRFCPKSKTKYDVISCLSEVVRNDTMKDSRHNIPKECRQQLRAQLLYQRENVNFDLKFKKACAPDIDKLCHNTEPGAGQVLECLRVNRKDLTNECHKAIFKVEQELSYNAVDYALLTTCRGMISTFCHEEDESHILKCLKQHRDDVTFDPDCRKIVIHRMIEQNSDYRLNPDFAKACHPDISKFCSSILSRHPPDQEFEGIVVGCLKVQFREGKLRKECENQMEVVLREAALNYQLNPLLTRMCQKDIKALCSSQTEPEAEGYNQGAVEECLKNALHSGNIKDKACRVEVLSLIDDGRADIHVDPLLHKTCSIDLLKYCAEMQQGSGRLVQCLALHLSDTSSPLQRDCHEMLSQRMELYRFANEHAEAQVAPETFRDLYHHVKTSPSSNIFMMTSLILIAVIFFFGTLCGRVTNRRIANKNK